MIQPAFPHHPTTRRCEMCSWTSRPAGGRRRAGRRSLAGLLTGVRRFGPARLALGGPRLHALLALAFSFARPLFLLGVGLLARALFLAAATALIGHGIASLDGQR